jgi:2-polyprenyl-3-methyl-5-hydroxy-6-metoxy-1,4-benzoquinol methylase
MLRRMTTCHGSAWVTGAGVQALELEHVVCNLCGADDPRLLFVKHQHPVVVCRGCGLGYVTPRPAEPQLLSIYRTENYYRNANLCAFGYGDYVADQVLLRPVFEQRLAEIERLRPRRGRLLDIGCATGLLIELARARGWDAHGIDVSDFAVRWCRQRGLPVEHGDVNTVRFPAGHFDVVVMDDTIEHLLDPRRDLAELRRILRGDGLLTINTANHAGVLRYLMGRHWFHYKPMEHLYYFCPKTLAAMLETTGFRVTRTRISGKIVTARYVCGRVRAYSAISSQVLLATLGRLPGARRPFFLPIGEFASFADAV